MKKTFWIGTLVITLIILYIGNIYAPVSFDTEEKKENSYQEKWLLKADSAKSFVNNKNLNSEFCILIDMSVHSGKKRLLVWDFKQSKAIYSGLCCHGNGLGSTCNNPVFSNVPDSHCTSLGKYKTGIRSHSKWGINIHYKLHGLEKSNDNAFKRYIVLHSFKPVPNAEIYPVHLPLGFSHGCPVISNSLMTTIDSLLQKQKKPTLLWIFN